MLGTASRVTAMAFPPKETQPVKIRVGYEIVYECPKPTPMMLTLNVHYTRASDLLSVDHIVTSPAVPITA